MGLINFGFVAVLSIKILGDRGRKAGLEFEGQENIP
jgi:hypothetical protein